MTRTAQSPAMGSKRTVPRWRRVGPLAVLLVAVAALAAGCGSADSHDAASSSNATHAKSSAEQSEVRFANCMRSHGITDFPDPLPDGGFDVPRGVKGAPQFQSASLACGKDLPGGGPSAKHANVQEELNFAHCMRSHGITDFPDPLPGGGWDITGNTNTPQFEAAANACRSTGIHWSGP
jgi:uncharacterized protein YceK